MRTITSVAGLAVLLASTQLSGAELIVNGGFEAPTVPNDCCTTTPGDPLPGWTVFPGDVNVVNGTFFSATGDSLSFEGAQHLDLIGQSGAGSISQTFNTVAGERYRLRFAYSHNLYGGSQSASAGFSVDGLAGSFTHTGGSTSDLNWITYDQIFVADGSSATLNFTNLAGTSDAGAMLDAISVTGVVPEPATWTLLILGMGAVGSAMRRRQRVRIAHA